VGSQICVALLISCVLWDEVKVFSADNQGAVHFRGNDFASQDTATDRDHTSEWAFLVCKVTLSASSSTGLHLRHVRELW
jgi:hypothetical protein